MALSSLSRNYAFRIFFVFILLLILDTTSSMAAVTDVEGDNLGNPDVILETVKKTIEKFIPKLLKFARTLFSSLATLSLFVGLSQMILSGESNLGSVAAHLLKWIIYVGFFMLVMGGGEFFLPDIITSSFARAGEILNDGNKIMPGDILMNGMEVSNKMLVVAWEMDWDEFIVAGLSGLMILVVFGMLAAVLTATLIEMYLVICGGAILLGFAGISYTKDIALAYLKYSVSVGVKVLIIALIAAVAKDMTDQWLEVLNLRTTGQGFFSVVGFLVGGSITLLTAAQMVPSIAQNVINGASVSTGSAITGAAAAMVPAKAVGDAARSGARRIANMWRAGKEGSVKNIGGYLLTSAFLGTGSRQTQTRLGLDTEGNTLKNGKNETSPGKTTPGKGDIPSDPPENDKRNP